MEDDALVATGLVSYLQGLGAIVTWVTNIAATQRHIEDGATIDIAIVDLNLDGEMSTPVIDQLLERNVYTILCTGYDANSIEARFLGLPRSQKPFTRASMKNLIAAGL